MKLAELLEEAIDRARSLLLARAGEVALVEVEAIAEAVGIGSVKYADLSSDRTRDYRFDWDRMLSFDGNTAPYIQYAHARTCSILQRAAAGGAVGEAEGPAGGEPANGEPADGQTADGQTAQDAAQLRRRFLSPEALLPPVEPEERELAKRLVGLADAVTASVESYSPHKLCAYLFDLATSFTSFYEHCPVLRAPDQGTRASRLALSALAGAVLERGLSLLGIAAPERM